MTEKLWFSQALEGLFVRGVGADMTPALRQRLLELGIALTHLRPAYGIEVVARAIRAAGEELFPGQPEAQALRQVGALFMRGYAETLIGRAMVQFMRIIGPRRSLERMQANFRTGGNYVETRFTSLGPGIAEVWFNEVCGIPDFYAGIIARGGAFAGARELEVTFEPPTGDGCTFRVEWKE